MEMEDHHNNHHHPQQYGMADLRQLMNGAPRSTAPHFPSIPPQQPTAELFQPHRNLTASHHQHYDMMMFGRHVADVMPRSIHDFASDSPPAAAPPTNNITVATPATTASAFTPPLSGLEAETPGCLAGDASTGRWPRQETLTLLEIRSRLDPKFKEANQKGPLWDEVSRIMSEEYGYQRSGKKCREKFENLYKYYKKTKEGKARRQDGKHYRFFRQLEALYGGNNNSTSVPETNYGSSGIGFQTPSQTNHDMFQSHNHKTCDSLSLTNSTDLGTSSSEDNNHLCSLENDSTDKGRKRSSRWKAKIKEFIDSQMKKLIEKQEAWMDRLVNTLEQKEKERVLREEEWRRQEAARLEMEHKFRAKERAWIEARDAALMDALQKLTGKEVKAQSPVEQALIMASEIHNHRENQNEEGSEILNGSHRGVDNWSKSEITRLLELRAEMESGFQQSGCSEEVMWEEVANKMACFGYERTALMCKHKWGSITSYTNANKEGTKKRKEKSRSCFYFDSNVNEQPSLYNHGSTTPYCDINVNDQRHGNERLQTNDGSSPSNSNAVAADVNCFPFFISTEGSENLWENYGLKINKGNQNQ